MLRKWTAIAVVALSFVYLRGEAKKPKVDHDDLPGYYLDSFDDEKLILLILFSTLITWIAWKVQWKAFTLLTIQSDSSGECSQLRDEIRVSDTCSWNTLSLVSASMIFLTSLLVPHDVKLRQALILVVQLLSFVPQKIYILFAYLKYKDKQS